MAHNVATKIRDLLEEQQMSISAFEKKAGLKSQAVHNIVSGKINNPSFDVMIAISKAIGCSLDELSGEGEKSYSKAPPTFYTNSKLFAEVLAFMANEIHEKSLKIDQKSFLQCVNEIYEFCQSDRHGEMDSAFAKWLLAKHKDLF